MSLLSYVMYIGISVTNLVGFQSHVELVAAFQIFSHLHARGVAWWVGVLILSFELKLLLHTVLEWKHPKYLHYVFS